MTRFELSRLLGARALQLSLGAPAFVKVEGVFDPYTVAKREYDEKKFPLAAVREMPDGSFEAINPYEA